MDSRQSVCATVSPLHFLSLSKEVKNKGGSAISNRINFAAISRQNGDIKAAEDAEKEAKIMREIAEKNGLKL